MSQALKNKNLVTGFTQIDLNQIPGEMPENELLVTASQDDATPRQDIITNVVQEAKQNDRQIIQPVNINENECDSVGSPPKMETLQSDNKEKFILGVEPGKLKINDSQELLDQKLVIPFQILHSTVPGQQLSPITRNQKVSNYSLSVDRPNQNEMD